MSSIVFIDTEVCLQTRNVSDYGAVNSLQDKLHTNSENAFTEFISGNKFICGHNIIAHDLKYILEAVEKSGAEFAADTLYLSPLLFPQKPYHALLKDDKLNADELNNPLNDAIKAMQLFYDEVNAFENLDEDTKDIFCGLLYKQKEFYGFFRYIDRIPKNDTVQLIRKKFKDKICENCGIDIISRRYPIELAYCLALVSTKDKYFVIPHWVHINFPDVENVMRTLRSTPCENGCGYCDKELDVHRCLKSIFGYENFREYDGEPLQEKAVKAAVANESLLAVFPTGGGKSITFQLPALIAGEASRGLTVVISPLQSLMKDQVDNLEKKGIADAVTINGLLSPIERAEAIERVESGIASLLYISPESLRSRTIERLFLSRNIARFVIDEAHCFSSWGQDFRVDYLYIGDFIRELQEKKQLRHQIPVSCFTATAKQKVIADIKDYFKRKLALDLKLYTTNAARTNLRYEVIFKESEEEKYTAMRDLIEQKNCPTIVYVSRTKRTKEIAAKLCSDGFKALPFNGKMDSAEKQKNQEAFIRDEAQIIVATSAFGMGVDKSNVGLVIHYDISDSLENYVQEAGRAGRDQSLQAECYVLFNDGDLDKHFILLNQTKLSMSEIQQVWKAIKAFTKERPVMRHSALEIARRAGWDDNVSDIETRVKTAVLALENAGYIKRGKNVPHIYANSIRVPNMADAGEIIDSSFKLNENDKIYAKRIINQLISSRSIAQAGNDDAESRVDYISDRLGIDKADVIRCINIMREDGILDDSKDLTAYIRRNDTKNKSLSVLNKFTVLEKFLLDDLENGEQSILLKELNEKALNSGIKSSTVNGIKTIFYYWTIKGYIERSVDAMASRINITPKTDLEKIKSERNKCVDIAKFIVSYLYDRSLENKSDNEEILVLFSILELKTAYESSRIASVNNDDIENALLYLAKIDSMRLEGGFLVLYNGMEITRLELDNKIKYKKDDYRQLEEFYTQKIRQIHIVGEYAHMMVKDYDSALQFVNDYFQIDHKQFIGKYFAGERSSEIERNITPKKFDKLFNTLSEKQLEIVSDNSSQYIVVTAGPGSGKTRVLVHKLASLLLLEDVKHEQLLMVTFSRAAATEFKNRLYELIGNAAAFVEIKTFHSYCFDLLGKIGSIENSKNVVSDAAQMIRDGEVELGKITKTVIVIDEAQDMDGSEFALIEALMERNEEMRVIAVGDDDQNIYGFRGSDSKYMRSFITEKGAAKYELTENYRSCRSIVSLANVFAETITNRMKIEPIIAVNDRDGELQFIRHRSYSLDEAVANHVIASYDGSGTACVLTSTNEEALRVTGLLQKLGQKAKLIQSNNGFDIYNIAEIRYFIKKIESGISSPVIDDGLWEMSKNALREKYSCSECLGLCLDLLSDFEKSVQRKYKTDLDVFIHESRLEDFYHAEKGTVLVSTIHKTKGREFDNVYMLLNNVSAGTDEERRKLYVGITRARSGLYIHCNNGIFDGFEIPHCKKIIDENIYPVPNEITVQLTHRDVNLGFFKGKKEFILKLMSGLKLVPTERGMGIETKNGIREVIRYSKSFFEETVQNLERKGYKPLGGAVRFIVAWKNKDDGEEYAVILPDVYFGK
ncbi:MAG: RecQ family ATP-dependent DNA helicase [Ruminococcus sp.]|nr:RecQ family ATP-dependent DNA helicase [Ruminococcus sp.]